jgi:alpha-L-fucosidase
MIVCEWFMVVTREGRCRHLLGCLQWFDGGIEGDARPKITAMLKKMQPHAVAFNGCVVKGGAAQNKSTCITPNALRWIGTEAGVAPDPNWSTGYNKGAINLDSGDPNSPLLLWRR